MLPLFVRGRPVLKILYESGLAPKCAILALSSCPTKFTGSKKCKDVSSGTKFVHRNRPFAPNRT